MKGMAKPKPAPKAKAGQMHQTRWNFASWTQTLWWPQRAQVRRYLQEHPGLEDGMAQAQQAWMQSRERAAVMASRSGNQL